MSLVTLLTSPYYRRLVAMAYEHPNGTAHLLIKKNAKIWLGLDRGHPLPAWTKHFSRKILKAAKTHTAQHQLHYLGDHPIGVGNMNVHCFATDINTASIYLFGTSDNAVFFDIYKRYVRQGSTVVDVGANVGLHSLALAHNVGPTGMVYAFEPSKTIYARLQDNLKLNHVTNVITHNVAAGAEKGSAGFVDLSQENNIGISHISATSTNKIPITTLDEELKLSTNISLIKIDVEGFECEVLRGAQSILRAHRPALVVEVNTTNYEWREMLDLIPYPANAYHIPETLRSPIKPLTDKQLQRRNIQINVLIIPSI